MVRHHVELETKMTKRTIWKYPLEITDTQNVMMPEGAEILSAQMQGDALCLWALVNPEAPKQRREIEVLGTGNPAPDAKRRYISTTQMHGGALVWHIFERE
jgi:hypothetical protein